MVAAAAVVAVVAVVAAVAATPQLMTLELVTLDLMTIVALGPSCVGCPAPTHAIYKVHYDPCSWPA